MEGSRTVHRVVHSSLHGRYHRFSCWHGHFGSAPSSTRPEGGGGGRGGDGVAWSGANLALIFSNLFWLLLVTLKDRYTGSIFLFLSARRRHQPVPYGTGSTRYRQGPPFRVGILPPPVVMYTDEYCGVLGRGLPAARTDVLGRRRRTSLPYGVYGAMYSCTHLHVSRRRAPDPDDAGAGGGGALALDAPSSESHWRLDAHLPRWPCRVPCLACAGARGAESVISYNS